MSRIFSFINVDTDINDDILHISQKNTPKTDKGTTQTHHLKVTDKIKENTYIKENFLSNFQLYLFVSELKETKLFSHYTCKSKLVVQYDIVRYLFKLNYYLFVAPYYKIRRFSNQMKASLSRIF